MYHDYTRAISVFVVCFSQDHLKIEMKFTL